MFSWFRRPPAPSLPPPPPSEGERPAWLDEITDALQKQTRAATKQSAKLEAVVGELDARVVSLGESLKRLAPPRESTVSCDAVFDALDGLDAARALISDEHLSAGLLRIGERLERFCEQQGYARVTGLGKPPEPRMMRVVGTEPCAELAPGRVSRVVRATVLRGNELVREGSVIVSMAEEDDGQRMGN